MIEKASARNLLQQDPGRENRYASYAAGIPILAGAIAPMSADCRFRFQSKAPLNVDEDLKEIRSQ